MSVASMASCSPQYSWVILASAFLCIFLGSSYSYIVGILHVALLDEYRESYLMTAWLGSLFSAVFCLMAPLGSLLVNNFSSRACVIIGASLNLIGLGVSWFSPNLQLLYLTYGLIAGAGQCFAYVGSLAAIGYYFQEQRTLALGIAVTGNGLGIAVFPPLAQLLLDSYDVGGTFLLLGGIAFQSCVFAALLRPHSLEIQRKNSLENNHRISKMRFFKELKHHIQLFKNIPFVLFCLSIFCWSSSLNTCLLYMPDFFIANGASRLEASILLSLFGIGSALSRILTGIASVDGGLDRKIIYFGMFAILGGISLCGNTLVGSTVGRILLSFLIGLYSAGAWVLLSQIAIDIVGILHFVTAMGNEMFTAGVGYLIGPLVAGAILQKEILNYMFYFIGILFLMTSVFGIVMVLCLPPDGTKSKTQELVAMETCKAPVEAETFLTNEEKDYSISVT